MNTDKGVNYADIALMVEQHHGKVEVASSNLAIGTIKKFIKNKEKYIDKT